MTSITLNNIEVYIETLVKLQVGDQPYTIDWGNNTVRSPSGVWHIQIPESALKNITVEES